MEWQTWLRSVHWSLTAGIRADYMVYGDEKQVSVKEKQGGWGTLCVIVSFSI